MTDRSKLLAEASSASERLMDFITDKPDWQVPEPKAVISLETATAFAMVYAKEKGGGCRRIQCRSLGRGAGAIPLPWQRSECLPLSTHFAC